MYVFRLSESSTAHNCFQASMRVTQPTTLLTCQRAYASTQPCMRCSIKTVAHPRRAARRPARSCRQPHARRAARSAKRKVDISRCARTNSIPAQLGGATASQRYLNFRLTFWNVGEVQRQQVKQHTWDKQKSICVCCPKPPLIPPSPN